MFVIELAFNIHFHNDVVENGRTNNFASFAEQRDNVWAIGGRPRNVNLSQNGRPVVAPTIAKIKFSQIVYQKSDNIKHCLLLSLPLTLILITMLSKSAD